RPPRGLHSFPPRRSSDLWAPTAGGLWSSKTRSSLSAAAAAFIVTPWVVGFIAAHARSPRSGVRRPAARFLLVRADDLEVVLPDRSEEHTSELQSQSNLVC